MDEIEEPVILVVCCLKDSAGLLHTKTIYRDSADSILKLHLMDQHCTELGSTLEQL